MRELDERQRLAREYREYMEPANSIDRGTGLPAAMLAGGGVLFLLFGLVPVALVFFGLAAVIMLLSRGLAQHGENVYMDRQEGKISQPEYVAQSGLGCAAYILISIAVIVLAFFLILVPYFESLPIR